MESPTEPTIERLHPEAQAAADAAAEAAGLSTEDWVSRTILNTVRGGALAGLTYRPGGPEAPPAVSLPNQRAVEKAANAAGMPVEEWLSRAVLESLAANETPPSEQAVTKPESSVRENESSYRAGVNDDLLPYTPGPESPEPESTGNISTGEVSPVMSTLRTESPGNQTTAPAHDSILPGAATVAKDAGGGLSYAESFEAERLAEILNRAPVEQPAKSELQAVVRSTVPLVVVPGGSPPSQLRPDIGRWASVGGIVALLIVAAWIWFLPVLKPPAGKLAVFTAQLPQSGPAGKAAATGTTATGTTPGGQTAAVPKAPARPAFDPSLPPPTKTATQLPKPAAKHWAWYEAAAKLGNTNAQLILADLYLRGDGVQQNYARAGALYRQAAVDGNEPKAQYALGVLLERGEGVRKDEIEALLWYKRAARAGHALAMFRAGLAHAKGGKVPQDFTLAREFLESAAKLGIPDAGYQLGLIHERGLGGRKNLSMAFDAYAGAAATGHKDSAAALGRLTPQLSDTDIIRSKVLPTPAAEHLAWYTKASRLGKTPAQLALARIYLRGDGVPQNYDKAAALFRRAAVGGRNAEAQHALAVMLERGAGPKKNMREALRWYSKAAENGYAPAMLNLGFIYVKGVSVPQNFKKARDYFERAAAKNLAEAQYNLGLLYQHGLGVEKNVPMAFKWFSLAVANQNAAAGKALDQLIPTMTAEEITKAKQLLTGGN